MEASADVGPEGASNVFVDEVEVEPFGVEVSAAPALHVGVFGIVRIGDDGEELLVAVNAANIFRRSGASAFNASNPGSDNVAPTIVHLHKVLRPNISALYWAVCHYWRARGNVFEQCSPSITLRALAIGASRERQID
jgi:hypothetical protein